MPKLSVLPSAFTPIVMIGAVLFTPTTTGRERDSTNILDVSLVCMQFLPDMEQSGPVQVDLHAHTPREQSPLLLHAGIPGHDGKTYKSKCY